VVLAYSIVCRRDIPWSLAGFVVSLHLAPISLKDACQYIADYHRHHKPPQGHKFSIAARDEALKLRGVVIVGRPVARMLDDGYTAEVTRLCTDGEKNCCSLLYAAAARAAKAMGYRKVITYILESESGASLKASGWKFERAAGGGSWSVPSRPRIDKHPLEPKQLWSAGA
jgi:hypothetical protein